MDKEFAIKQRIKDCLKVMNLTINKVSRSEQALARREQGEDGSDR